MRGGERGALAELALLSLGDLRHLVGVDRTPRDEIGEPSVIELFTDWRDVFCLDGGLESDLESPLRLDKDPRTYSLLRAL
jgi:hypothetical protein